MWSIIKRYEDQTYDIVPNSWLVDDSTCYYPDVGLKTTKAFAIRCQEPEENWDISKVLLIERNIGKIKTYTIEFVF